MKLFAATVMSLYLLASASARTNQANYARSSNANLELIAQLYDVAPNGRVTQITKGAVLGSLRALDRGRSGTDRRGTITWPWPTLQRDDYLKPGQVYRFDIALAPRRWTGAATGLAGQRGGELRSEDSPH